MKAYPYPRLSGPVTARVTAVRLRGPDDIREQMDSSVASVVDRVVALGMAQVDGWHTARLTLGATIPASEIRKKGHWSELAVVAVLTEGATNARTVVPLECASEDESEWTGEIEVNRDEHLDRASLTVHVVATVGGISGRVIATTEHDWVVDMTAEDTSRDRELDIATVSFSRGAEWLRGFRDAPWVVDTSGRMPRVRLNSDFEGLAALFEAGGSPLEQAVAEVLAAHMGTEVWTAVFHTAIGDLEVEEDGTPQFPPDWRGAVLREMLPDVLPTRALADALREVHRCRTGDGSWTDLQPRIHYAAARRAKTAQALSATVRGIERLDQETHA